MMYLLNWTDSGGNVVDPNGIVLENDDCAPAVFEYLITVYCLEDSAVVLSDEVAVTVVTDDISPFVSVIEEDCFVDVVIDQGCEDHLNIIGDIPVINPGDVGSTTIEVWQTSKISCDVLEITLSWNCACSIDSLSVEPQECMDSTYMVLLDFSYENTNPEFVVFDENANNLCTFNYADLPVLVGPFLGDPSAIHTLTVQDAILDDCVGTIEFGPIDCQPECIASSGGPICPEGTLELFETGGDGVAWEWSSDGAAVISDVNAQKPNGYGCK